MARPCKYQCDHQFFDEIDTEPKAYWLGFLAADGCIFKNTVNMTLAVRDRDHMLRFQAALHSDHRLYERPDGRAITLCISSASLVGALAHVGVVPRKTFILRWPVLAPLLMRHYLRGYFDGDGCFTGTNRSQGSLAFSLAGNREFLMGCQGYMVPAIDLKATKLVPMPTTPQGAYLMYCGTGQVQAIAAHIYRDASVWLERKRALIRATPAKRGQYGKPSLQTHCKREHEFTAENTYLYQGRRVCRECLRLKCRGWQARNPEYLRSWRAIHPDLYQAQIARSSARRRETKP